MKFSKYNFLLHREGKYYNYNSLTNSFFELTEDLYHELKGSVGNGPDTGEFPSGLLERMGKAKILVKDDWAELQKIRLSTDMKRFSSDEVFLTIAPTMKCNFNCFYCFEASHEGVSMNDDVANAIISYVSKIPDIKKLNVTWFGGEPLLELDRIISLTRGFKKIPLIYSATLITNGYLLTENMFELLDELKINCIQITIDGMEKTHDKRRPHKKDKKSFEVITGNLVSLASFLKTANMKIVLSIRVNIDKTNAGEYASLCKFIYSKIDYPHLEIYPGWVKHIAGRDIKSFCVSNKDIFDFLSKNKEVAGVSEMIYPANAFKYCFARSFWSVVVDALGNCYKCWEDIDNEGGVIGNIEKNDFLYSEKQLKYLYASNPFDNEECKACNILPICTNCPKDFLIDDGIKCSYYKNNMDTFLNEFINIKTD